MHGRVANGLQRAHPVWVLGEGRLFLRDGVCYTPSQFGLKGWDETVGLLEVTGAYAGGCLLADYGTGLVGQWRGPWRR